MFEDDLKRKIEIMQAALDGDQIECISIDDKNDKWEVTKYPKFDWVNFNYRIAVGTKPSINWDSVHQDYKWMAKDSCGRVWLFTERPYTHDFGWCHSGGSTSATMFASVDRGTCNWKDSLVARPN